jgi:phosphoglycolate phosphatase
MEIKMYDYIIWDFNGTILDDTELCVQTENKLRVERNLPEISINFYQDKFCFPIEDYYKEIGMPFVEESFAEVARLYMEIFQPASLKVPLRAGVYDFMLKLKSKGCKQILLSASQIDNLLEQTDHFGLTDIFDEILGLGDIYGVSKIEIAKNWFDREMISPSKAVVIGDTIHDYDVAKALKCACILFTGGHCSRERLLALGAPVIDSVEELTVIL